MTATKGSDGDLMAVAVFCLEQARQAIRLFKGSPQDLDTRFGLDDFARAEYYPQLEGRLTGFDPAPG